MRALLLSVGSRGDAEPFCALTKQLLQCEIQVDLFLQRNLRHLADPFLGNPTFRLLTFPFGTDDFYTVTKESSPGRNDRCHPDPRMTLVKKMADIVEQLVLPCLPQVLEIRDDQNCQQCVIITSAFTRSLAFLVAQARINTHVILLHLQPLLPNRVFPSYRVSREGFVNACLRASAGGISQSSSVASYEMDLAFEDTYWKVEHALEEFFLKERVDIVCRRCFGNQFSPLSWNRLRNMLTGKDKQVFIANAYSNHLVPPLAGTPGLGCNILDVGPLADDYVSPGNETTIGLSLKEFLEKCESADDSKPICIGFGSMPFHNVGAVLYAIKTLKVKAVLVGSVFQQIPQSHPAIQYKWIVCVSDVPYTLLLPRCSMMLCHGGIGVVQSCMRAGIPCLISPLMGDQFALSQLVEAKGLGARCGSKLTDLTAEEIIQAVQTGRACINSCRELGREIRQTHHFGTRTIAELIIRLMKQLPTKEEGWREGLL